MSTRLTEQDVPTRAGEPVPLHQAGPPRLAARAFARLAVHLARRQLASSYHLTLLGWAWPVARQLVQLAVLVFLFSRVLNLNIPDYPVFVFIGLLSWTWTQGAMAGTSTSVIGQRHLVNQPRLPNAVLPVVAIAVPFVDLAFGVPILVVMLLVDHGLGLSALACLPLLVVQAVLLAGCGWLVAATSVLFRDVPNLVGVGVGVLFYLTPVFYGLRTVPDNLQWILHLNPLTTLIEGYRAALLGTPGPSAGAVAAVAVAAVLVAVAGLLAFRRLEPGFSDHL